MPKGKLKGENSKAVEARLRKNAVKEAQETEKKQKEEDELWRDDDKHIAKKQQRKDDREKKKQDTASKKQELKELYTDEMTNIKTVSKTPQPAAKVTRAQIQEKLAEGDTEAVKQQKRVEEAPIEENVNRQEVEGEEARDIQEAISILRDTSKYTSCHSIEYIASDYIERKVVSLQESVSSQEKVDMNPEKRVKAAYAAFEAERLPQLKEENKNMRLSQLKQLLKKEWMKSPQNPLNSR